MRNILSAIILAFMVTACMTSAPITSTQTRSEDAATSAASVPAQTSVLRRWSGYGITFEYVSKEEAFIDGQRADIIEREPGATVYQSGDKTVIHYFPQQKAYYKHGTTLVGYLK